LNKNSKRVLLTGGAGFIGSHLAEALIRAGNQLTIVDNLDSFYSPNWKEDNLQAIGKLAPIIFLQLIFVTETPLPKWSSMSSQK
jgi:UDP-glucose 4-epimerase